MIQVWEIDKDSFFTGKSYLVNNVEDNHITTPLTVGYIKARFYNGEWVEGATQEEIDEWKKEEESKYQPQETTEEKVFKLEQTVADLEIELLELK